MYSSIDAITNRLSGIRSGGNPQNISSPTRRPPQRTGASKDEYQSKVDTLINDPVLFAEFKRRVSETNNFSNAGASFVLHEFLEDLELPAGTSIPTSSSSSGKSTSGGGDVIASPGNGSCNSNNINGNTNNGFNSGFGLLQSLRTMALDQPTSPAASSTYQYSPRGRFFDCPVSPGSVQNLSPTKTPLTPISATSASATSSSTPVHSPGSTSSSSVGTMAASSPGGNNSTTATRTIMPKETPRSKGSVPACLEQPSLY